MPRMAYEQSNPSGELAVFLGASLGTDRRMWDEQVRLLPDSWNIVRFDLPGHGASRLGDEALTIDDYADDVVAIADEIDRAQFAFCGLSIGGAIGQSLGGRHGDRLSSLVLASTGLTILSPDALRDRARRVRAEGTGWVADLSATRWFAEEFQAEHPEVVVAMMAHLRDMQPDGYADACTALAGFDGHDLAPRISVPTLVIYGEDDHATPPASAEELADAIVGVRRYPIAGASHLCNVERPEQFTTIVREHVEEHA